MPTQMPLTPLTAQQIADRLARLADLDLELEELDAAKAAFNEADKDQRKPIVKERAEGTTLRDPGKSRGWKAEAAALIAAEIVRLTDAGCVLFPAPCGVSVHIAAIFTCPVSAHRKREPLARCWAVSRGRNDADNVAKACLDALTRAGAWEDDGQVVSLFVEKIRAAQGEAPRVIIIATHARPMRRELGKRTGRR